MALLTIVLDVAPSAQDLLDELKLAKGDARLALQRVSGFIAGVVVDRGVQASINVGGTRPTSTITFTGAPTAAQTCSINGVTFTARASGAVGNEFNIGANIAESAANLAAAVNASTSAGIAGLLRATSAAGVVTLTAILPRAGTQGLATTTTAMTNTSTSGAFAGGADISNAYRADVGR